METRLTEFVEKAKAAAGSNLTAVVLYGSAVTAEFAGKYSDLNLLCIVVQAGARELQQLHPLAEWWVRHGNPPPLIFTMEELRNVGDIYAIELLDMKLRHRMLFGPEFLHDFEVSMELHKLQVERELRTNWLRLRQAVMMAPSKGKAQMGIMLASITSFCAIFRHALIALGQPSTADKRDTVNSVASITGANPSAFMSILDLRQGKQKERDIPADSTLQMYLEFVEVATNQLCSRVS